MLKRTKVFRDPVHGLITFDKDLEKVLLELIETYEFQRLRRIRQLGLAWVAYHGAEHSRFSHSLGVCHLVGLYMDRLYDLYGEKLYKTNKEFLEKRKLVRCAALLHDIGHGPFSHVFESAIMSVKDGYNLNHEYWTRKIITAPQSAVCRILRKYQVSADDVSEIIKRTHRDKIAVNLVSSQFDADRMDYLQRDSLFTGVRYGLVDQAWLIHSLRQSTLPRTGEKVIAVDSSKGKNSIVNFLLARRNLFQQVYFHHKVRAAEIQLSNIFERIGYLVKNNRKDARMSHALISFFKTPIPDLKVEEFTALNDYSIVSLLGEFATGASDPILRELCNKFVNNKIMKSVILEDYKMLYGLEGKVQHLFKRRNGSLSDFRFFHGIDYAKNTYYENDYTRIGKMHIERQGEEESRYEVWVLNDKGDLEELSTSSREVQGLMGEVGVLRLCFDDTRFKRQKIEKLTS